MRLITILLLLPCFLQAQIKFNTGFETDPIRAPFSSYNGCCAWSLTRTTDVKQSGNSSAKFELRRTDTSPADGNKRNELTPFNVGSNAASKDSTLRWWQYYTYFKTAEWPADVTDDIFSQWHDYSTSCSTSPPLAFRTLNGNIFIDVRYNLTTPSYCSNLNANRRISFLVGPMEYNVWTKWTINYEARPNANGKIRVWKDGKLILYLDGPNDMNGTQPHYWKFGIYKWPWAGTNFGGSVVTERKVHFDDLVIGDTGATKELFEASAPNDERNQGANVQIATGVNSTGLSGPSSVGGFTAAYQWTVISGPVTPTFSSSTARTTTVNGLTADGNYVIRLRIANGTTYNYSYYTITRGTPAAVNEPPTITNTTPSIFLAGTTSHSLSVSASDEDGTIASYSWTQLSGSPVTISNANTATATVTGATNGVRQYRCVVYDNDGDSAFTIVNVRINFPPVATARMFGGGSSNLPSGTLSFRLDGEASDVEDAVLTNKYWKQINGPTVVSWDSLDWNPTITINQDGEYEFELTVTDSDGDSGKAQITVYVNPRPVISMEDQVTDKDTITYTATVTDDGTIANYEWGYISGPNIPSQIGTSGATLVLSGMVEGIYNYYLTVTDNHGSDTTEYLQITVSANDTPVINQVTAQVQRNKTNLRLNITAVDDEDGENLTYVWYQVSGSPLTFSSYTDKSPIVSRLQNDSYELKVRATDQTGRFSELTFTFSNEFPGPARIKIPDGSPLKIIK